MAERESTQSGPSGKYRPIAELGHGGMAQVFLALASGPAGFNKLVVLKQIREQLADDPEFLTMFLDEARLAARLNHPNVVQTNEVGSDGRRYFICMEYLEGQPLNRIINRIGRAKGFTLGMHVRVLVDALAGLHHAHELRDFDGTPLHVVHRDATPHNIFVTYAGQVKVVDFGIAKAVSSASETRAGVLKGKVSYMPPEQAASEPLDRRADIYSVGMILWEALSGTRLFKGMQDVAILQRLAAGPVPRPSTVNPQISPRLEEICMTALAPRPEDRFSTAAEMAAALEEAIDIVGERGSVREAGRLLEGVFAAERATIQKLVEAQANEMSAAAKRMALSTPLPLLDAAPTYDESGPTTSLGSGRSRSISHTAPSATASSRPPPSLSQPPIADSPSTPSTLVAATASQPPRAEAKDARTRLVGIAAAAGVALVLGLAFIATRNNGSSSNATNATNGANAASSGSLGAHTILIDSTPQGASVRDGDKVLGTTPMSVTLDPGAEPRKLVLELPGYRSHTFLPTREDTRLMVPLALAEAPRPPVAPTASVPASPTTTAAATGPVRPRGPAGPAPPATARPAAPSDINTAR